MVFLTLTIVRSVTSPSSMSCCRLTFVHNAPTLYIYTYIIAQQDPLERKYQCIKLGNAHLRQTVLLAKGGLPLLCFGPCAFQLTLSSAGPSAGQFVLQSAVAAELLVADKSASFRTEYVSWLRKYVDFLRAVAEKL